MKIQLVFRGGAVVVVDVENFATTRSPITDGLGKLEWTTPDGWKSKLHTVDPSEVVAVIQLADDEGVNSDD